MAYTLKIQISVRGKLQELSKRPLLLSARLALFERVGLLFES